MFKTHWNVTTLTKCTRRANQKQFLLIKDLIHVVLLSKATDRYSKLHLDVSVRIEVPHFFAVSLYTNCGLINFEWCWTKISNLSLPNDGWGFDLLLYFDLFWKYDASAVIRWWNEIDAWWWYFGSMLNRWLIVIILFFWRYFSTFKVLSSKKKLNPCTTSWRGQRMPLGIPNTKSRFWSKKNSRI